VTSVANEKQRKKCTLKSSVTTKAHSVFPLYSNNFEQFTWRYC